MTNKPGTIYGLFDPRNGELRYVGQTVKPLEKRLAAHICASNLKERLHVVSWMKGLLNQGLKPEIRAIQEHHNHEALLKAEVYWIAYFREAGCRLTNGTDGGKGGPPCHQQSQESRRKAADSRRRWYETHPNTQRPSMRKWYETNPAPWTGKLLPTETKNKMAAAHGTRSFLGPDGLVWTNQSTAAAHYGCSIRLVGLVLTGKVAKTKFPFKYV